MLSPSKEHIVEQLNTRKPNDGTSTDLGYESLYFDSQKKNEDLMKNNFELVRKLDFALGKIDAYEKMMIAKGAPKGKILV